MSDTKNVIQTDKTFCSSGYEHQILDLPTHVKIVSFKIARRIIEQNHYLGYAPCGCKFCLGIYAKTELIGVMILGHPIARMEEQKNTLELTRMYLFDSPKNSESKALSLAEKWIRNNRKETRLIAYSDTAEGHKGIIYKAANWTKIKDVKVGDWKSGGRIRRGVIGGNKIKFERLIKPKTVLQSSDDKLRWNLNKDEIQIGNAPRYRDILMSYSKFEQGQANHLMIPLIENAKDMET